MFVFYAFFPFVPLSRAGKPADLSVFARFPQGYKKDDPNGSSLFVWILHAVALLEAIDTAAGVNQLLLAGEVRVALGADFNAQLLLGGTGDEGVAADAGHGNLLILRMDAFLHVFHLSVPQYYRMKSTKTRRFLIRLSGDFV